jgi:ribonuclease BN (tRNA processing enzyme)
VYPCRYPTVDTGLRARLHTGDSWPDPALADLGADADLFIMNASQHHPPPAGTRRGLLAATEAGELAHHARARRLLLAHFGAGIDRTVSLAGNAFTGEILAAEEDQIIPLAR